MGIIIVRLNLSKSTSFDKFKILVNQKSFLRKKFTIIKTGIEIQPIFNHLLNKNNYMN